ncbi:MULTISPECIES: hypothetical protein [unclassified Haladaptatus]|uniref:hypothetical protein n=1 Tax=unclassified Haladaptatus TaxID=2622732 RepID=UPI00209BFA80|nr:MULTISPECIES: hypothetical protein [unclassified Haladaptatus]MCO8245784.1 hypothetical protein [Haladaptatus sp. AB643]MCO8256131.1 hypothetical protein [Haladaptatus sp. AB618]
MNKSDSSGVLYGIVGIVGAFLLYWGVVSIMTTSYVPSVTFPWLDRTLTAVGQYVWIPAIGVLLLTVSVSPLVSVGARRSRIGRVTIGGFGVVLLGLGGAITALTISPTWGFLQFSPVVLTGVLLMAIAFGLQDQVSKRVHLS